MAARVFERRSNVSGMDQMATLAREFERESYRIDQLVWDAMALRAGESALFCGSANNVEWIKRAVEVGVDVSVISGAANETEGLGGIGVKIIRGSTSIIPARDGSFDATVAFHYLHEVDPFFHANIVSELARVGKRCIIIEPAPPSDALGQRIATLYSRAKRDLGQFENYHHIDYWRKLLSVVRPNVVYRAFAFTRTPPREAIRETVALIIATMAAEDTPEAYLSELRVLAKRPDAQLLPQARYVITGAVDGELIRAGAGTTFRDRRPTAIPLPVAAKPLSAPVVRGDIDVSPPPAPRVYNTADTTAELPPVEPPRPPAAQRLTAPAPRVARNAFGLNAANPNHEARPPAAGGAETNGDAASTFGLPASPADAAAEFGWEWETPEGA